MTTTQEIFALAEAALQWDMARRVALQLQNDRNGCRCEHAETDSERGDSDVQPCWKIYEWSTPDDTERLAEAKWCVTCRRRQRFHEAFRKAMKIRGARMRTLQRFALRGMDLRSIDREVTKLMAPDTEPTVDDIRDHTPGTEETPPQSEGEAGDDAGETTAEESGASE